MGEQHRKGAMVSCGVCNELFKQRLDGRPKTCSRHCARKLDARRYGPKNWKGGKYRMPSGYIKTLQKDHPAADQGGYVMEHRLVMERIIGRGLTARDHVHHKNGIRDDNRPENLELWAGRKDPPGQRAADLLVSILNQPELESMDKARIEAALRRVLM